MAMGTSGCYADVIDINHVRKIAKKAFDNFIKVLTKQNVTLDDFAQQMHSEEVENDKILLAWMNLVAEFELNTSKDSKEDGLRLNIGFHDKEECGDIYDEVDGTYFSVDGMYQLTTAGKNFQKFVSRQHFTQWG